MEIAPKLGEFDVKKSYSPRTLDDLDALVTALNQSKKELSRYIGWYMRKREDLGIGEPDIDRLCRALASPDLLADRVVAGNKTRSYKDTESSGELMRLHSDLYRFFLDDFFQKDYIDGLSIEQFRAVNNDVSELGVYARMYLNIGVAGAVGDPVYRSYFPKGNPFDHVMDLMGMGGVIVRFKYVSRRGSEPVEKVVSYHPMESVLGPDLAVHVEGDKKFSMSKMWGTGDDSLAPLRKRYKGTIVRWDRNDTRRARDGIEDKNETFLY